MTEGQVEVQPKRPTAAVLSVGDWMVTLLVLSIPLINIIMLLVWALSDSENLNRRNYCRASIFWFLIVGSLSLAAAVFFGVIGALFHS